VREHDAVSIRAVGLTGKTQSFFQAVRAGLLHATVSESIVTSVIMVRGDVVRGQIRPASFDRADRVNRRQDGVVVRAGTSSINLGCVVRAHRAITREEHVRLGFVSFRANEIADSGVGGREQTDQVVDRVIGTENLSDVRLTDHVTGAHQNLGGAQFIGQHVEVTIGRTIALRELVHVQSSRKTLIVVTGKHLEGQGDLLQVAGALDTLSLGFGLGERGKEHAGENRDDRDHDQQFNQRERLITTSIEWLVHGYLLGCERHYS